MPFKTKQAKIRAEARRFSIVEKGLTVYKPEEIHSDAKVKTMALSDNVIADDYSVKGDLFRILLLAIFILASQFLIKIFFAAKFSLNFIN